MDEKNKDIAVAEKKMTKKSSSGTSKSSSGSKKTASGTPKKAVPTKKVVDPEVGVEPVNLTAQTAPVVVEPAVQVAPTLELHTRIPVRNASPGGLVYKDSHTGLMYKWGEPGDIEFMELGELRTARNTQPKFFEKNWWEIDEVRVLEWLNATKFYKNSLMTKDFDVLFGKSPEEIVSIVEKIPEAQKDNLILRVRAKIAAGEIDSLKVIRALQESLGVKLSE